MIGRSAAQSDARLAARARAGDERAFEQLVRRHRAPLVSYCRRLGLDGRAEDAVQQAFLSAWLALRRGQEVRDVRSWLGRIAHNKAVDLLRAGAEGPGDALSPPPARGGFEESLELRQTLAGVAALPPRQRDALVLSAIDGRSYEEVAGALGVSEGAVRGLLQRARATLRAAAGALAPLPLLRAPAGWLRRASVPVGRVAELAAPNAAGGGATGATLRAAAAAVTTVALAAGVAVGPLHSLITGHARHRAPRAGAPAARGAPARHGGDGASASAVAGVGASRPKAQRSAAASSGLTTATARAPVPAAQVRGRTPDSTHPQTAPGVTPSEPSPVAPTLTSAGVASNPSGQVSTGAPAAPTPAPETPAVAEQPEASKPPETSEHEEQSPEHEEESPGAELERPARRDS